MSKNYNQMYEEKVKKLKESILGTTINDQLEMKAISDKKLEAITEKMSKIVGKPVWEDFNFRTGKIFGIMRFILQNRQHTQELLKVTNLTKDYVDLWWDISGNLPYLNTTDNTLNVGRPMDVESTKEFIKLIAVKLDVLVEDSDLLDINQERWDRLYQNTLAKIAKTVEHNQLHGDSVPTQYDE